MRNLSKDSSHNMLPLFCTSKAVTNGKYCNSFMSGIEIHGCPGQGKDDLKQKILEHESVFKNQVCELHRLYSIQRGIMDEVSIKELCNGRASMEEPSCSSSIQGSEEATKRHMASCIRPPKDCHSRTSILGVEVVDSCISRKKQISTQPKLFSFHNGSNTSRDCEVSGLTSSKAPKKLFDLQRPADEYVDVEEGRKLSERKLASDISNYAPNGNLFTDSQASASCLKRRSIAFYDLNEPIKSEESVAVASSFDFLGNASINGDKELTLGVDGGFLKKPCTQKKSGVHQDNTFPTAQDYHHIDKFHLFRPSLESELDPFHHEPRQDPTVNHADNFRRDGHSNDLKSTDRTLDIPNNNHFGPIATWPFGSYPFSSSSWFNGSWARSASPWAKPSSYSGQKMRTFENSSRTLQPAILSQEHLGEKRKIDNSTELNPGVAAGKFRTLNGCYQGSGSGSNEPARFSSINASFNADSFKSGIDIDLNQMNSNISSNKGVVLQDLNIADVNHALEDKLPWLNSHRPHCTEAVLGKSSYFHATSNQLCRKTETIIDLNQPGSSDWGILRKNGISANQSGTKILGVPIFDGEIERSSLVTSSVIVDSGRDVKNNKNKRSNRTIDLNLECEPEESIASEELIIEKKKHEKGARIRDYIDLNSCINDFEDPRTPYYENKVTLDIDLEVAASMESEDDASLYVEIKSEKMSMQSSESKNEKIVDIVLENVAKIMTGMSSLCSQSHITDTMSQDPLHWFVDAILSCEHGVNPMNHEVERESTVRDGSSHHDLSLEIDEFEAMTLQLQGTEVENYMPKHFVPQIMIMDEADDKLPTRHRARRGRQRKNFQRDVLAGMKSLSRHEVIEDLQTFSGLMKATGHSWNGGARGRRRAVSAVRNRVITRSRQKVSNGEVGFEDRSLAGWGKTTRRPRGQRCAPTGNHQMHAYDTMQ